MIACEFVGTVDTVAAAVAAAAIGNYRFVTVVVENYTLGVAVDFVDDEVYSVGFVFVLE